MSGAVLQFPAAAAPVVQRQRRGKLPAGVLSIQAYRLKHQRKHEELVAANSQSLKDLCHQTLARIHRGEVTGLAIIEARGHEKDIASASGAFADKFGLVHLQRALYAFADVASQQSAKANKS